MRLCVAFNTPVVGKRNSTSPCSTFALGKSPSEALTFCGLHPPAAPAQLARARQSNPCCSFRFTVVSTPSESDPSVPTARPHGHPLRLMHRSRYAALLPPRLPRISILGARTQPNALPFGKWLRSVSQFLAQLDRLQSAQSIPCRESAANRFPASQSPT